MIIQSKSPIRIDVAGGTLDLWPLYLFFNQPSTIHFGINLFSQVKIESEIQSSNKIRFVAKDQNCELEVSEEELFSIAPPPALDLHIRLLRYFYQHYPKKHSGGLLIESQAKSPAGAGLGGSSSLCISLLGAMGTLFECPIQSHPDHWIQIAKDIETQVIQVPAGFQDYYGAMFGRLQKLEWNPHIPKRTVYSQSLQKELSDRILLFYSGRSRNSGINNWQIFKDLIDKKPGIHGVLAQIAQITTSLDQALVSQDWDQVGQLILAEMNERRKLAPGISTPEMDQAFQKALSLGATGYKICGAGGGGCFMIYSPNPDEALKKKLISSLQDDHIRPLPFEPVPQGLSVKIEENG